MKARKNKKYLSVSLPTTSVYTVMAICLIFFNKWRELNNKSCRKSTCDISVSSFITSISSPSNPAALRKLTNRSTCVIRKRKNEQVQLPREVWIFYFIIIIIFVIRLKPRKNHNRFASYFSVLMIDVNHDSISKVKCGIFLGNIRRGVCQGLVAHLFIKKRLWVLERQTSSGSVYQTPKW